MCQNTKREQAKIRMQKTLSPLYRERRAKLIIYKGGICDMCGLEYNGENGFLFSFHHVIGQKVVSLTVNNMGKPWRFLKHEADKTYLLCLNCHAAFHSKPY